MFIEFFLVALVALAATTDLTSRRIPNPLVVAGLAAAFMLQIFLPSAGGWKMWLSGALTGFGLFLPFYLVRGMAAGDVKLMAAVGSFVGPLMALKIALATFLVGGAMAITFIVFKGKIRETGLNLHALLMPMLLRASGMKGPTMDVPIESVGRMPYAVAIALGTVAALFFAHA